MENISIPWLRHRARLKIDVLQKILKFTLDSSEKSLEFWILKQSGVFLERAWNLAVSQNNDAALVEKINGVSTEKSEQGCENSNAHN